MNLLEKSLAVKEVFQELDAEISEYIGKSKLHCFAGCGGCCMNPKVSATVLEFLPLAFDIYQSGHADEVIDQLAITPESKTCVVFQKTLSASDSGNCSNYTNRGLICRLFGMSARKDKYGVKQMITCKKIKEGKPEIFQDTTQNINGSLQIPMASEFYSKLSNIDESLVAEELPVNEAIKYALERVMMHSYYMENQQ